MTDSGGTGVRRGAARGWLAGAGEVVLSPFSFLLYRVTRSVVQTLVQLDSRRHPAQGARWRVLDGQAVGRPFNLLALMTSAPRWNTHALIALAGPLRVQDTITIDATTAAKSAAYWTVVVHAEPTHHIIASVGSFGKSGDASSDNSHRSLKLPAGSYRLALRYYRWREPVILPAIEVDGVATVAAASIPADTNDFYHDLDGRGRLLYLCLHSYVCTLVRFRRWLPRSFVAKEYLPAGNPQTTFHYGFLPAGTELDIELEDGLLQTHDAYFTAYSRASFPVMSLRLTESRTRTPPSPVTGSYLIRLLARRPTQEPRTHGWVTVGKPEA